MDALHLFVGRWAYRVNEMIFMSLKGTRFFYSRLSATFIYSGKKSLKGQVSPFLRAGILVIENEMGPTGLKPRLFNKLLLTVSNWF